MKKRIWVRKMWEKVREKETALRDEIPAALTLNTYYTCYAIDKFILYLYRDRIYDILYVILYLYGLLHTLSPKLPFHRAAERTWVSTWKAQDSKEGGRKWKRQILEKTKEAWTHPTCQIYPFLFGGRYRLILEILTFQILIEKNRYYDGNYREDREKSDAKRTSMEEGQDLGASEDTKIRTNRIYRESTVDRTNDRTMNRARSWQTTKCRCFFEVAGGPKVD